MSKMNAVRETMRKLWPVLSGFGVEKIKLSYSGSGDSGMFEEPKFEPDTVSDEVKEVLVEYQLRYSDFDHSTQSWVSKYEWKEIKMVEAIENVASELVYLNHPGWENNEGGRGDVVIDCDNYTVEIDHTEYVIESIDSAHKLEFRPDDLEYMVMKANADDHS